MEYSNPYNDPTLPGYDPSKSYRGTRNDLLYNNLNHYTELNEKGVQCFKSGKYKEALGWFIKSIERNSKDATVWANLGDTLLQLKVYDKAIISCDAALSINVGHPNALRVKGVAYNEMGNDAHKNRNYNEAVELYKMSLSVNSNNPVVWSNIGYAYHQLKMYGRAAECFDKALSIDPNYAHARSGKNSVTAMVEGRRALLPRSSWNQPMEPGITQAKVENTITDIETGISIGQEPRQFRVDTPNNPNPYDAIRRTAWNNRWQ
jgi:tetratricopeptide (TPR) repeat protein